MDQTHKQRTKEIDSRNTDKDTNETMTDKIIFLPFQKADQNGTDKKTD